MKIDWKQKLSSRKFWTAVAAWVTSLLTAFNVTDNDIAKVCVIIAGIGSLCVYMLAEAKADVANAKPVQNDNANAETTGFILPKFHKSDKSYHNSTTE